MTAHKTHRLAVGSRFKMSRLGNVRCSDLLHKTGTVVEISPRTTGITVLFDGAARPTVLHRDYIPQSEK